jgi:plastocyanin domain-containing protein
MNANQVLVVLLAIFAIGAVNWYFMFSKKNVYQAATASSGLQEITVRVKGGYSPDTIQVKKGQPVRIVFDRQEDSGCSEEVVFPDFGIRTFLAPHGRTAVEFLPEKTGNMSFACGMSMLRGKVIVS